MFEREKRNKEIQPLKSERISEEQQRPSNRGQKSELGRFVVWFEIKTDKNRQREIESGYQLRVVENEHVSNNNGNIVRQS